MWWAASSAYPTKPISIQSRDFVELIKQPGQLKVTAANTRKFANTSETAVLKKTEKVLTNSLAYAKIRASSCESDDMQIKFKEDEKDSWKSRPVARQEMDSSLFIDAHLAKLPWVFVYPALCCDTEREWIIRCEAFET